MNFYDNVDDLTCFFETGIKFEPLSKFLRREDGVRIKTRGQNGVF